jgi:asparagine synthase (glutamine-hydrolysing)
VCGIVGIAGIADEALVRRMAATIVHRGPDGDGYFANDGVALGARRLSIIDLPGSNQPIFNEDGSVVTVFNGEIYNYQELRSILEAKGHALRTAGDTEVLVHLYEEYGEAGVHLLRGMFAYAIWDRRRRRLLLARDRLGIKPLYYAEVGGRLVFASEIKALMAVPGASRDIDAQALDLYLTLQYVPGPRTMLSAVRKIPPGHLLIWEDGRTTIRRYWDIVLAEGDRRVTEESAAEEFADLLDETIRLHRISDVPVGVLLSGGLDSSSVTAMLARTGGVPRTFTVGFDVGGGINELAEAAVVAQHLGTDHHEIVMGSSVADLLQKLVWMQDEPVADAAAIPTYFVCRFAAESVKVVLTGEGGDELLGGYPRYWWLDMSERLRRSAAGRSVASVIRDSVAALLPHSRAGRRLRTLTAAEPLGDRHLEWIANMDEALKSALRGESENGGAVSGPSALVSHLLQEIGLDEPIAGLMYVDFKTWLPDNILAKIDRMSMAVSVEARVPLLDHRLVEFVAALPHQVKIKNFGSKRLLRRIMKPMLPARTLQRRKQAFLVPLAAWLRDGLREILVDTLQGSTARQRGLLRPRVVAGLIDDHLTGRYDHGQLLWNLLTLELWCKAFVDADPAAHA